MQSIACLSYALAQRILRLVEQLTEAGCNPAMNGGAGAVTHHTAVCVEVGRHFSGGSAPFEAIITGHLVNITKCTTTALLQVHTEPHTSNRPSVGEFKPFMKHLLHRARPAMSVGTVTPPIYRSLDTA